MKATLDSMLDVALSAIEQQIQSLAKILSEPTESVKLEQTSAQLRNAVQHLAELAKEHAGVLELLSVVPLQPRLAAIASFLDLHRDNLGRLTAINDRQLEVLLPKSKTVPSTYGQSGSGSARIYRAAG